MVSKIRYHSFKEIDLHNRVPFITVLVVVLVFVTVYLDPPRVLCIVFVAYGLSGPILTLWNIRKKRRIKGGKHPVVVKFPEKKA